MALPLAPAIATFIFRASLVQTACGALRERNPAIALATPAGVGQGQGVSVRTATAEPFKSEAPMLELLQLLSKITPSLLTHVGTTIRIPNPPYMTLTVENIGPGPRRLPALSLCHYGEQNGDAMRDPEMCFEMELGDGRLKEIHPFYWLC